MKQDEILSIYLESINQAECPCACSKADTQSRQKKNLRSSASDKSVSLTSRSYCLLLSTRTTAPVGLIPRV
jgi:hypothetical protein